MNESIIPDFRGVSSFEEIQDRFVTAAKEIISNYHLEYGASQWRITALELYLRLNRYPSIWLDPSTDQDAEQLKRETWYIRQKKAPGYWRIDITAGSEDEDIHAGLLIRGISGRDGPSLALHKMVRGDFLRGKWPENDISRLNEIHGTSIHSGPLRLVSGRIEEVQELEEFWIGPRVGLGRREDKYRLANLRVTTKRNNGKKEDAFLIKI